MSKVSPQFLILRMEPQTRRMSPVMADAVEKGAAENL